jgi:hypothetical protein
MRVRLHLQLIRTPPCEATSSARDVVALPRALAAIDGSRTVTRGTRPIVVVDPVNGPRCASSSTVSSIVGLGRSQDKQSCVDPPTRIMLLIRIKKATPTAPLA